MNTAELIYQESQILPENLRIEVFDFIGYLKKHYALNNESINMGKKIADLEAALAPYQINLKGFIFNRDEANY